MIDRRALLIALAATPLSTRAETPPPDILFAEVRVNGRSGRFLVDTGAPRTVLDLPFAQAALVKLDDPTVLRGDGGRGAVGGHTAYNVAVQAEGGPGITVDPTAADLSGIRRAIGQPMGGILGSDYFGRLVLELDYRRGVVAFRDPTNAPPTGSQAIRILQTPYVAGVASHRGRRLAGSFQIDTGSNTAVELYAPASRRSFPGVQGQAVDTVGIAGQGRSFMAPLDRFEGAGLVLEGAMTDFADPLRPDDAPRNYAGLLGGPAFHGRVLTIDYARARLWLDAA
jgi:hypothetical protein